MTASTADRRSDLTQLFVYMPSLRMLLRDECVPEGTASRLSPLIQEGDRELARTITDPELAAARRAAAARFAEVFPAGV